MSGRDNTWVDYGNLAANIFTVGLLVKANQQANQIASLQAQQVAKAEAENELRQFIFDLEGGLESLTVYIPFAPLGVYVMTRLTEVMIKEAKVDPSAFDQFVDKDRVRTFNLRLAEIQKEAVLRLSSEAMIKADRIVALAQYRDSLQKLIAALEAKDRLTETEPRWKKLSDQKSIKSNGWKMIMAIGLMIGVFSMCLLGYGLSGDYRFLLPALAIGGLMSLVFLVSMVAIAGSAPKGYDELNKFRKEQTRKLLPLDTYQKLCERFGEDRGLEGYKALDDEIGEFFSVTLEHDQDGIAFPKSLFNVAWPKILSETEKK